MLDSITTRVTALETGVPATLNALFSRVTALETDVPTTISSLLSRVTAFETDVPITMDSLLSRVTSLETVIPVTLDALLSRITALETNSWGFKRARNFAHFADGARILPELTSLTRGTKDNNWLRGFLSDSGLVNKNPPYVISDDQMSVGSCWEINGTAGVLGILLSEPIHVSSMSIDTIHPSLVSATSSLKNPRTIALWGMLPNSPITPPVAIEIRRSEQFVLKHALRPNAKAKEGFVLLLSVHYDPRVTTTNQVFNVHRDHWAANTTFSAVLVEISENWGGDTTCLYRLQVHGRA